MKGCMMIPGKACSTMESIHILCDAVFYLSRLGQFTNGTMGQRWLCEIKGHDGILAFPIACFLGGAISLSFLGSAWFVFLCLLLLFQSPYSLGAPKVWNSSTGANSCAGENDHMLGITDPFSQSRQLEFELSLRIKNFG
mmetsp:Transcript_113637/g.326633  ORF Transcript_113637/g.326633 Transcript_113637/m.326633 type:complete len:139 (+) Transcript_113637:133-549(+)